MRALTTFWRDCSGAVAVEGAILFPIMATMGFGIIDASMLMLQNHKVEQGLVAGANYLARAESPNAVQAQARNVAVTGHPAGRGKPRVSGWEAGDVTLNFRTVANNGQYRAGATVRIAELTTSHPYTGLGFIKLASGGQVRISAKHEERLVRAR